MAMDREIRLPMGENEEYYLLEENEAIVYRNKGKKALEGKWVLSVETESMDSTWRKSCSLYRQGAFAGITSLKSSTAKTTSSQSIHETGVIMFYCGPLTDESKMMSYGKNIVKKLNYYNQIGHILYEREDQTFRDTQTTDSKDMYWLPVPKTQESVIEMSSDSSDSTVSSSEEKQDEVLSTKTPDAVQQSPKQNSTSDKETISRVTDFEIRDVLGYGGFAIVFKAYQKIDDHEYAIKRIPLPAKEHRLNRVLREVRVLAKLNHVNVVRYYGCWHETHDEEWVREHDQPWKQKLRDGCLSDSFRTPVADNTSPTNSQTPSSISNESETNESRDDEHGSNPANCQSEDEGVDDSGVEFVEESHSNLQPSESFALSSDESDSLMEPSAQRNTNKYLYIQMELCARKTLKQWMMENTRRPKQTILKYFLDIVCAVEHVHDRSMIHRDLKPSNIFFELNNEFVVKVGDFGLGTNMKEYKSGDAGTNLFLAPADADADAPSVGDQHTKNAGTFSYMSPEQRGHGKGAYTYKVDIFSMGLILFEMLWVMRTAQEKSRTLQNVRDKVFPDGFAELHPEEHALLQMMLHEDPNQRPTTRGIRAQPLLHGLQLHNYVDGIRPEEHFELIK